MGVQGHTLVQTRKGYTNKSKTTIASTVAAQSGSGQRGPNESGGFAAKTNRGLKKRS